MPDIWSQKTAIDTPNPLLSAPGQAPLFSDLIEGYQPNSLISKRGSIAGLGHEVNPLGNDAPARRELVSRIAQITASL